MSPKKLAKIKEYQREYKKLFNERLQIDWEAMNEIARLAPSLEELFRITVEEYGASEEIIRNKKRLHSRELKKERAAVQDFCKKVFYYKLDLADAGKLLNRDRTLVYYYAFKM